MPGLASARGTSVGFDQEPVEEEVRELLGDRRVVGEELTHIGAVVEPGLDEIDGEQHHFVGHPGVHVALAAPLLQEPPGDPEEGRAAHGVEVAGDVRVAPVERGGDPPPLVSGAACLQIEEGLEPLGVVLVGLERLLVLRDPLGEAAPVDLVDKRRLAAEVGVHGHWGHPGVTGDVSDTDIRWVPSHQQQRCHLSTTEISATGSATQRRVDLNVVRIGDLSQRRTRRAWLLARPPLGQALGQLLRLLPRCPTPLSTRQPLLVLLRPLSQRVRRRRPTRHARVLVNLTTKALNLSGQLLHRRPQLNDQCPLSLDLNTQLLIDR
jgi:hypothetical protein